jgi:ATP-dependent DNA ligase
MKEPLEARRELCEKKILSRLGEPVRYAAPRDAPLPVLIESVKAQGLEGLVAKRLYETGLRWSWQWPLDINDDRHLKSESHQLGAVP